MSGKTTIWASTPEAKARLAKEGYRPPDKRWGCKKLEEAARKAEEAVAAIKLEQSAVGGNDTGEEEQEV